MQTEEEFRIKDIRNREIARNLIENGFDDEMIAKITGLELEIIRELSSQ